MQKTHVQLWAECLQFIKDNIGDDQYNAWFRDITSLRFENRQLHLFVPSDLFVEYIEGKYLRVLGAAIRKVYGEGVQLSYAYNVKADDPDTMVDLASTRPSTEIIKQTINSAPASPFQVKPQVGIDPQLNPRYTLENYCSSQSNKIAYSIAESIASNPSLKTFNPFFVFGATGVGKTHLIQGVGIRIKERNPEARVLYVTARLFESQYTTAVSKGETNKFFNFYQSIDTLIVDDVQDLQNKPGTQNTFFNIFNHLHLNNKQIILSSDRAPAEMEGFEDRLLGRFKWGMTVALDKPDLSLRREVLVQKAAQNGVVLSEEIINYISQNVTNSIREIEGVMTSLVMHATVLNRDITLDLAQSVVGNAVKINRTQINFESIAREVSVYYGLEPDAIFTKSRKREISDARQMIMYLTKKLTKLPLTTIGHQVARTHATVIHSIKNIEERLVIERKLQEDVRNIEAALNH
jgi:chromosomal replication initiator protein